MSESFLYTISRFNVLSVMGVSIKMSQGIFSSVKSKILIGFSLIILMIFVVGGTSILKVNSIANTLKHVDSFNSVKQRYAINFSGSVHGRAIAVRDLVLVETSEEVPDLVNTINKLADDYAISHQRLSQIFKERADEITPAEIELMNKIDAIEQQAMPLIAEVVKLRQEKNYVRAEIVMMEKARPVLVEWLSAINQFIDLQEKANIAETESAVEVALTFQKAMLLLLAVSAVLGIISALIVARSLSRSLGDEPYHVRNIAGAISSGNLAININTNDADSDSVIVAIANMRDGLTQMISKVRDSTEHINHAADLIDNSNISLSVRTDQQAASLGQIASSMTQLTSIVERNTDNARQATEKAESASSIAVKGGNVISEMVSTMASINESSRKVADITSVIDGIAFQTNILALNAAVEAARAGEHGRGFAVVATEVRNLAQRSATAAKEIEALINDSVQRVNSGNQLATQAGSSISDIVNSVHEVTEIISQITSSSIEQSTGIQQVGSLIQQMDDITHLNLAMVKEANNASHTLKDQITELGKLVSDFKMKDSEDNQYQHQSYGHSNNSSVKSDTHSVAATSHANTQVTSTSAKKASISKNSSVKTQSKSVETTKVTEPKTSSNSSSSTTSSTKSTVIKSNPKMNTVSSDAPKEELKRPKVYNLGGQVVKSPSGSEQKTVVASDHDDWEEF